MSLVGSGNDNVKVQELIEESTGNWDLGKVTSLFSHDEAEVILRIPLSKFTREDKIAWTHEARGEYTIKSGYKWLSSIEVSHMNATNQLTQAEKSLLRRIWRANLPQKIKVFRWRLFHDLLPTMDNLVKRRLNVLPICFRCKETLETSTHVIANCPYAKEAWSTARSLYNSIRLEAQNEVSNMNVTIIADWFDVLTVMAWALWRARNAALHEEQNWTSRETAHFALSYLSEFQKNQMEVAQRNAGTVMTRWQPPKRGMIKINFDGAYRESTSTGGVGVVARDENGRLLGALSGRVPHAMDAYVVEAFAAVKALQWATDMGFPKIQLEGDALSLIKRITSETADYSSAGIYTSKARQLSRTFSHCEIKHCFGNCNTVTHLLAQNGTAIDFETIWMEEGPLWQDKAVMDDFQLN